MLQFILNRKDITTIAPPGTVVLDFLRRQQQLTGCKEACRDGDCGSCTILLGERWKQVVRYQPVSACLLPVGEATGKHVVTVEGLNRNVLSPVQQALLEEGAVQCGFCTPGLVLTLTAFLLNCTSADYAEGLVWLSGNLCRCTGYAGIKRALTRLCRQFADLPPSPVRLQALVQREVLPDYFLHITHRLQQLPLPAISTVISPSATLVAGGTDLFVQRAESLRTAELEFLSRHQELSGIWREDNRCFIGAGTTVKEIRNSPLLQPLFPTLRRDFELICSMAVRHRATLGGNLVNASPAGDLIVYFLALDATVCLRDGVAQRELPLRCFYRGYKQPDKSPREFLQWLSFVLPNKPWGFNFEKICKRAYLDIASVNSAMLIQIDRSVIAQVHLSAGGVAPIPLYLQKTGDYLVGKTVAEETVRQAAAIAQTEIHPIDDIRGSAKYKRLLLRQLIFAHFLTLFPDQITGEKLL